MNTNDDTQISVNRLKQLLDDPDADFVLLDVRETWELRLAALKDERLISVAMGQLPSLAAQHLPQPTADHRPIYVVCHHGVRSWTVARWLRQQGWTNTFNVEGGLEAYRRAVDPTIGQY